MHHLSVTTTPPMSKYMVMSGRPVNLNALFLGKLRLLVSGLQALSAHTFASNQVSDNTPS